MNKPLTVKTPSDFVGANVRHFRERHGWRQRQLVERLHELGVTTTGWNQVKVHRLETGKTQRVTLEDLFELALDVSPLQLMVPHGDEAARVKVWIGGTVSRWPHEVKQWIRGVRPLLHRGDYRSDEEAEAGRRFYLIDSQPLSEWGLIKQAGAAAEDMRMLLGMLTPSEEEGQADAE